MEFVTMMIILFCAILPMVLKPSWWSTVLVGLLVIYLGTAIQTSGLAISGTTLLTPNTTESFIVMIFMTLGSLVSIFSALTSKPENAKVVYNG